MKKNFCIVACALVWGSGSLSGGDNLLVNPELMQLPALNGIAGWQMKCPAPNVWNVKGEGKTRELTIAKKDAKAAALVLQHNLKLEAGKSYTVRWEAKGVESSQFMSYCEWTRTDAESKTALRGVNTGKKYTPDAEYQPFQFRFTFPENCKRPYLVLLTLSGEVTFRNIELHNN